MIAKLRWWLWASLPAAQVAMLTVSTRHLSGLEEGEVPRYGFPLPFTWFSGFSSLHWDVAPVAWLVDLLVYALVLMPLLVGLGAAAARMGVEPVRAGRALLIALAVAAALVVGLFDVAPALIGWRHLTWELPRPGATRTLALAPFPPT